MANKGWALGTAVEIVKAYGANGDFKQFPADMLQAVYDKLVELNIDSEKGRDKD
jgi:hypothetical protein